MTTILHISSSSNLNNSFSRQIGELAVNSLKAAYPNTKIIEYDLVKNPVPHLSPEFLNASFSGNEDDSALGLSKQLINDLSESNLIVIEAPMYNFSIPSVLKAWIDHVVRAKITFMYTESGSQGLLKDKKVILVLSRGGVYSEGLAKSLDYQETYLRAILGFIGITDIESLHIEGVAFGAEKAQAAYVNAQQQAIMIASKIVL